MAYTSEGCSSLHIRPGNCRLPSPCKPRERACVTEKGYFFCRLITSAFVPAHSVRFLPFPDQWKQPGSSLGPRAASSSFLATPLAISTGRQGFETFGAARKPFRQETLPIQKGRPQPLAGRKTFQPLPALKADFVPLESLVEVV